MTTLDVVPAQRGVRTGLMVVGTTSIGVGLFVAMIAGTGSVISPHRAARRSNARGSGLGCLTRANPLQELSVDEVLWPSGRALVHDEVVDGDYLQANAVHLCLDRLGEYVTGLNAVDPSKEIDTERRLPHEHDLAVLH